MLFKDVILIGNDAYFSRLFTNLIQVNTENEAKAILEERQDIMAIIEKAEIAKANDFVLAEYVVNDAILQEIPMLAILDTFASEEIPLFMEHGYADVFSPPYSTILVQKRIYNAAKSTGSVTFTEIENMLKALPSNIYLKDRYGRYIFATHYWDHINHDSPHFSIKGKRDIEIRRDRENAIKAMNADQRILETGESEQYVIKEHCIDGSDEYLELIKCPVINEVGDVTGIVGLINNVTEKELMRQKLEKKSETDSLTGLYNKAQTHRKISKELQKSSLGSFFMIDLDDFKGINDRFGHKAGDEVLLTLGGILKDVFNAGLAGRIGGDEFAAFASGINAKQAENIAFALQTQLKTAFDGKYENKISISIGISEFPEDGKTFSQLYESADSRLYEMKKKNKGGILSA